MTTSQLGKLMQKFFYLMLVFSLMACAPKAMNGGVDSIKVWEVGDCTEKEHTLLIEVNYANGVQSYHQYPIDGTRSGAHLVRYNKGSCNIYPEFPRYNPDYAAILEAHKKRLEKMNEGCEEKGVCYGESPPSCYPMTEDFTYSSQEKCQKIDEILSTKTSAMDLYPPPKER